MSKSFTVQVQHEITYQQLQDLLIDAFETAISYWCSGTERKGLPTKDVWFGSGFDESSKNSRYNIVFNPGGEVVLDVDEYDGLIRPLNIKTIKKGIKVMQKKYPERFKDIINEDTDATTADVFVQCVVFGEVIFS